MSVLARLALELRIGMFRPHADDGPGIEVQAFGEAGRALAKDGADVPASQAVVRSERLLTGPGETADFESGRRSRES